MPSYLKKQAVGYAAGVFGVAAVALIMQPFLPGARVLIAGNLLLVVVLLVAMTWGMGPALVASAFSAMYLNYFFVPPFHTLDLHINGSEDEVALLAFIFTSVTVGRLSSNAQQRARENRRLYDQLRSAQDETTRLEVARRNERFKSALLDSVTHDLRTPLTSIKAASTAIVKMRTNPSTSSPQAQDRLLDIIVQQSDRLNNFIEGLIELATVEAPGHNEIMVSTAVDEIINAAIARASDALCKHEIQVECLEGFRATVNARAIAQVLYSLLENAGKYAPAGTAVRIVAESTPEGSMQVAVEDEGPGVAVAQRNKIFDKFFRGEPEEADQNHAGGLGLGLAIAREIVEVNGGRIWVEERGAGKHGARFVFQWPMQANLQPDPVESEVP